MIEMSLTLGKAVLVCLAFVSITKALVTRGGGKCCFQLNASGAGGAEGTVGQLSDGQNRVYGSLSPATYCIDSSGGISDSIGRGCFLTPQTTQFQCDASATPSRSLSIACNGALSVDGNSTFYECPTGDNGENNLYTIPPPGQSGCFEIILGSTNCRPDCTAPPLSKTCPVTLNTPFQYPHGIFPVSSINPDKASETSYYGDITPTTSSIFVFDIPSSYAGSTCSLLFFFPKDSDLKTSSYTLGGSGALDFAKLQENANSTTTWNNKPQVDEDFGITTISPGSSYNIATFDCPAGEQISFQTASSGGTDLNYFQDYNPPAAVALVQTADGGTVGSDVISQTAECENWPLKISETTIFGSIVR